MEQKLNTYNRLPNIFWQGIEYYWYSNIWYDEIQEIRIKYPDAIFGRPWIPKIPEEYDKSDITRYVYKEVFNKLHLSIYLPVGKSPEYYRRIYEYNEKIRK